LDFSGFNEFLTDVKLAFGIQTDFLYAMGYASQPLLREGT